MTRSIGGVAWKLFSFISIVALILFLFSWVDLWVIILLYVAALSAGVIAWLVVRLCSGVKKRRKRAKSILADSDAVATSNMDKISIDKRICQKLFVSYGEHAKWRWICKPPGFYEHGGFGRIEMVGTPYQFADICLKENGYLAIHVAEVQEVGIPLPAPVASPPTTTATAPEAEPITFTPPPEPATPVTPISRVISLSSPEGVEKWFRIAFYETLSNLVNDLNNQGSLSLTIFKDGKAYIVGSENMVYDFGKIPDEQFWDIIVELLENEGLFAEERDGAIFISWSY